MKNRILMACALGLAVLGCKTGTEHDDDKGELKAKEEEVDFATLPANVQAAFQKAYPGARVSEAKRETYSNGTVHYEVEFTSADGKKQEVELDSEGEVLPEH